MISQTILGRYTSIEYRMKYRVSYDTILDPLSRVYFRMQTYAVYRNTQTILRTWGAFSRSPMPIYAVGIAQMPSINTPTIRVHTRRDLRRSINAIMRVSGRYPAMSVCSSVVVAGDVSDGDLRHLPSVCRL